MRLSKGMDVVCIFVDDTCDSRVIEKLRDNEVKLIALRCAGFNNVDLHAAAACHIPWCACQPIRLMPWLNTPWGLMPAP